MNIQVDQIINATNQKYPYTHRVAVVGDALAADKVSKWLNDNKIPHTKLPWGVYYLRHDAVEWLLLRWS